MAHDITKMVGYNYTVDGIAHGLSDAKIGLLMELMDFRNAEPEDAANGNLGDYVAVYRHGSHYKQAVAGLEVYIPPVITEGRDTRRVDTVPYTSSNRETDALPEGETRVAQVGVNGYTEVTYIVTYTDGVETYREELHRRVVDPIDEIIEVGTYVEPEPEITTETVYENQDPVQYNLVERETDRLPLGERETVQEGVDGYTRVEIEITYHDGIEHSRRTVDSTVIPPVDEIIEIGTYVEPEPDPEDPDDGEEGEDIESQGFQTFAAGAYRPATTITPFGADFDYESHKKLQETVFVLKSLRLEDLPTNYRPYQ